jgi:hypothetical protein
LPPAVEQLDTQAERDLLAGERIDQCLEQGRESRWLQAAQASRQLAEARVASGRAIEVVEAPIEAEQTTECRDYRQSGGRREARAPYRHLQPRTLRWRDLHDFDVERALIDHQNPAIDGVDRPPPQRLNREVEAKRWHRLELERRPVEVRRGLPDRFGPVNRQIFHELTLAAARLVEVSRASTEWA